MSAFTSKSHNRSIVRRTSNLLPFLLVLSLFLSACQGGAANATPTVASTSTPQPTFTATLTSTPTITPSPTATPTPKLPVIPGTMMPQASESISAINLDQVIELARWGKGVITDVVYASDGSFMAVSSSLGISIRQTDTLDEISFIETGVYVNGIALSSDGQFVAAGLDDKTAKIWNVSDGSLVNTLEGHTEYVRTVAFSSDGTMLAAGSGDKTTIVWNIMDGSMVTTVKGQILSITSVLFSPDGQFVYSGSADGTVRKVQLSDGTMARAFGAKWIYDMALSADGKTLAVYDNGVYNFSGYGELILWDTDSGKKINTIKGGRRYGNDIRTIALSPDGKYVAAGWRDYSLKVWSVDTGGLKYELEDLKPDGVYYYGTFSVSFSPDSEIVAMAGRNVIGTWKVSNGSLINSVKPNSEAVIGMALSPDGKILASTEGIYVTLRNVLDGSQIETQDEIESTGDIAFSPDGNSIAVGLWEQNAKIWPINDSGARQAFETDAKDWEVSGVAFSPDGSLLALGISPYIELHNASDGSLIRTMNTGDSTFRTLTDLSFSADGTMIASAIYGTIKVFRVEDGKLIKSYNQGGDYLAFSPDGSLIAGGSSKGVVQIWKNPEGASVLNLKEPVNDGEDPFGVSRLTFSPDGATLVVGYYDGTIRVWQVSDGALLQTWKPHSDTITGIIFTPDGTVLITSSYDGTIRFWGLKP